jgi:hypothetical protein
MQSFGNIFQILIGIAIAVAAYFIYLAASKGLPVAISTAKAWWQKGEKRLAAIEADILALKQHAGLAPKEPPAADLAPGETPPTPSA